MSFQSESKSAVRSYFLRKLSSIASQPVSIPSLTNQLQQFLATDSLPLCAYVATFKGEIDLSDIIDSQLNKRSVYVPVSVGAHISFVQIESGWKNQLVRTEQHTLEPQLMNERALNNSVDAVVLVPGLAFTKTGQRLGRGKGSYDRFLSKHQGRLLKVGVCHDWQLVQDLPIEKHDVLLDYVCTSRGIIPCKNEGQ